ncbi:mannose-1-phosphate guanylyltransferase [Hazenella sp. IB182357]|uniref:Mannose-1-phosphate guanylyltransferase n=1 Tax=Polycladospora coralii TaxID=2771432 RepID=A0A926N9R1_9BACL|nr:sugar phosphate nucleotidyltransferase [Polycladospora coralii]MBD1371545.1 mannose-1-phosphate guanylyltransferase [Polycladospora coralii]
MRFVLLSGGMGKRLWPLSNQIRSKQFLRLLDHEQGLKESMIQRNWRQLTQLGLTDNAIIATHEGQKSMISQQIGASVPLVIEPAQRDTFPAISLATTYLQLFSEVTADETIIVIPVDLYVDDHFFESLLNLDAIIQSQDTHVALMGIKANTPSERYGYIVPQNEETQDARLVERFVEKPDRTTASKLIEEGAMWNSGVFAFKCGYLLSKLNEGGYPNTYHQLLESYHTLPCTSFDYEIIENEPNKKVVSFHGLWKDLGTWESLTEEMPVHRNGKGRIDSKSINTHLVNELNIPIIALGMNDCIIAASQDGILVADKAMSNHVKHFKDTFLSRPMYEERQWGWYKVLDHQVEHDHETLVKRVFLYAGKNISYQMHNHREEVWTITKGRGKLAFNGKIYDVAPSDIRHIPVGSLHGLYASTDLEFIEVQSGDQLVEEDIKRLYLKWEDIERNCTAHSG